MVTTFMHPRCQRCPLMCYWPIVLQAFCPPPFRDLDQEKHNLVCPVRAMDTYVHRAALWKTDQLFVCFGPPNKGFPANKQMLSRWLVETISLAYESSDLPSPLGIRAHSTTSIAASKALLSEASLQDVCDAVGRSSMLTFVRFCNLDLGSTPCCKVHLF